MARKILVNNYPAICLTNRGEVVFCRQEGYQDAKIGSLITFASEEKRQRYMNRMYKVTKKPAVGRKRRKAPPCLDNGLSTMIVF